MTTPTKINLLHLWSVHHPRDFVRRVEELLTDLYERVERLEGTVENSGLGILSKSKRNQPDKPGIRTTTPKKK